VALRTQHVIAEETGAASVIDPLGGSWYLEALTDRMEQQAEQVFRHILDLGGDGTFTSGLLHGIEDGWFTREIAESAFAYQQALETGAKRVVGVNVHRSADDRVVDTLRISPEVERDQRARLATRRRGRDVDVVEKALEALALAAGDSSQRAPNLVPLLLDAARAEATLGELCDVLRDVWGGYTPAETW
jgi:methylmalonyl-CoA mutase N-terminal domain/subunit